MPTDPVWPGYFADPFVVRWRDGYVAYGTRDPDVRDGVAVAALASDDLVRWRPGGPVLQVDPSVGTDYWAPEVVEDDGAWWMLFSAGRGIAGHHLRVARAETPLGPFVDQGVDLTSDESFAIDPHPFVDADGARYLFFAHDVLDAERPGTHLAVRRMRSWTEPDPAPAVPVLAPNALWQRYAADREMYGRRLDWYTLEGPTVVRTDDGYLLLYSGGSWEGDGYGVASATATSPLGPWRHGSDGAADVLSTALTGLRGPGHASVLAAPDGLRLVFHAWDPEGRRRRMHIARLDLRPNPHVVLTDQGIRAPDPFVREDLIRRAGG